MKRRFLYYSLVAAMTASAVTFSSCDKDDDENTNTNTTTTTTNDSKEEGKFSVNINLNGEPIIAQQGEVGKNFSLNLEELAAQEALKGYEILSISKDGNEVSGNEIEITADSKIEINAVKYATLEYELPNQEGKILYSKQESNFSNVARMKKDLRVIPTDRLVKRPKELVDESWIYTTSDNKLKVLHRLSDEHNYIENAGEYSISYDKTTGKVYTVYDNRFIEPEEDDDERGYFFKIGDKYYIAFNRFKKSDETVKGYKTTWTIDAPTVADVAKLIKKDGVKLVEPEEVKSEQNPDITITDEKFGESDYDYEDGIITVKINADNEVKFVYDGTYLYAIVDEYSFSDYTKLDNGKLLSIAQASLPEDFKSEMFSFAGDKKNNVYVYKMGNMPSYIGFYDWNGDGKVYTNPNFFNPSEPSDFNPDMMFEELLNTIVVKFDKYPFGEFSTIMQPPLFIFPDGKIARMGGMEMYNIAENSIFTDGDYIVIDQRMFSQRMYPSNKQPIFIDPYDGE